MARAKGPKFKAGDAVSFKGRPDRGVVTEVPVLDERFLEEHEQFYSVQLEPWVPEPFKDEHGKAATRYRHPADPKGDDARYRAHETDVLGCVNESLLSPVK